MPLVKALGKAKFEPYVWSPPSQDMMKLIGSYESPPKTLTRSVSLEGYPLASGLSWRGNELFPATWLLSKATFRSQKDSPLELKTKRKLNNGDLYFEGGEPEEVKPKGQLWLFDGRAYFTDDVQVLDSEDVRALINVEANKRRLMLEKAHALQAMAEGYDKPKRRESIPQAVRLEIWQRDGGRCVECDNQEKLEFDHIIPLAMGGSNTSRNLQLLCETCNRRKGASLG